MKEKLKNGEISKRNKKVSCYDIKTGDFIHEFDSIRQACYELKKNSSNCGSSICGCCKGKLKTAYGYYWSYEKKDNFFD